MYLDCENNFSYTIFSSSESSISWTVDDFDGKETFWITEEKLAQVWLKNIDRPESSYRTTRIRPDKSTLSEICTTFSMIYAWC